MRRRLLLVAITASVASACSLLVDTDDLSTKAADAGPLGDSDLDGAARPTDGSAPTEGGEAGTDPCAGGDVLFCSRFDDAAALAAFRTVTDPTTRVEIDGKDFVSSPASALFTITPSSNGSADATIAVTTGSEITHARFAARLRVDDAERVPARLLAINIGNGANILVDREPGKIVLREVGVGVKGNVPAPPDRTWVSLVLDLDGSVSPSKLTLVVNGGTPLVATAGAWPAGRVNAVFGVSETSTPTTAGWRVRWDDVVIERR